MSERIEVGFQAFIEGVQEEFGAIREVNAQEVTVYVENAGDFTVPITAVVNVAFGKVIFDVQQLAPKLRAAIGHAHEAESL